MKHSRKLIGWVVLLLISAALGFVLLRYAPPLSFRIEEWTQNAGPLILLFYAAFIAAYIAVTWVENKIAQWSDVNGNTVLAVLCAILTGGAVSVVFAINIWNDAYGDGWVALGYLIFIGIASGVFAFIGVKD